MVPVLGRSLTFAVGMFQHMAQTRDVATCRHEAELARAAAAATSSGEWVRMTYVAKAAWWAAVADRCAATAGDRERAEPRP